MTTKLTTLQHFSGDQPRLFGAEDKSQSQKAKYFPINIVIITDDKNTFAEICFMWLLQNKGEATVQWSQGTIDYITSCGGNQEACFKVQIIWCIAAVR